MAEFCMPSLGADMDEGTLLEWLVHPGDTVKKGDIIAVVDTAKAAVEVESFAEGVVGRLLVEPGTTVAVGTPLAVIGAPEPDAEPKKVPPPRSPLVRHQAAAEGIDLAGVRGSGPGGTIRREDVTQAVRPAAPRPARTRATPFARRLAEQRGVDLTTTAGTGPDGAIRARDLAPGAEPAASAKAAEPAASAKGAEPAARPADDERMRQAIARLMSRSKREIPHYYLRTEIDLQPVVSWLRDHNSSVEVTARLVPAAVLLAATARAAVDVPALNGYWVDEHLQPQPSVHLGVAISLRAGGMVTPAIHDAQALSPVAVMAALKDLVARARSGHLRASELTDATLTVTNLGDQGVDEVLGVIYPPQVALVGFGTVTERPWAVDGLLGVRPVVTATLSADHRATDGYVGARFLRRINELLQRPEEL